MGFNTSNQKMVSCASARDVQEVTLGFVNLLEIGLIADRFDSLLQAELPRHRRPSLRRRETPVPWLGAWCQSQGDHSSCRRDSSSRTLYASPDSVSGRTGAIKLGFRSDKDAEFVGSQTRYRLFLEATGDGLCFLGLVLQRNDRRRWTVENRYSSPTVLNVSVDVSYDLAEKAVCLSPDLMRRAVVDAQRT